MKRILLLLVAIVAMACSPTVPVDEPTDESITLYVYDSSWTLREVANALPRAAEVPATLQSYVDEYNETHTDDQLFITEGEVSVEDAPTCELWIVDKDNFEIKTMLDTDGNVIPYHLTDVPREEVVDRREAWRLECIGIGNGVLYVDNTPPDVIPDPVEEPDTRPDYVKYAVYLIDPDADGDMTVESTTDILIEDHCEDIGDYPSKDAYFNARIEAYNLEIIGNYPGDNCFVVSGRLYPAE